MTDKKVTLAFICRDETDTLQEMLASSAPYFDEIVCGWTGTDKATEKILKEYGVKYKSILDDKECWLEITPKIEEKLHELDPEFSVESTPVKIPHFANLRKRSFDMATNDLVMWLDSDDTFVGGEKLQAALKAFDDPRIGSVWLCYMYDFSKDGNCTMELWRERIVRKNYHEWKGVVHEVLTPKSECNIVMCDDMFVKHRPLEGRVIDSSIRNLTISLIQYVKESLEACVDPRTLYDVARSYEACGRLDKALDFFDKYLEESTWDTERYDAIIRQAEIYTKFSKYESALGKLFKALQLDPFRKEAYFKVAVIYFKQEMWEHVVYWTELGYKLHHKSSITPMSPDELTSRPLLPLASALFNLGKFKEATFTALKAFEFYPSNEWLQHAVEKWPALTDQFETREELKNHLETLKTKEEKSEFVEKLPEFFHDDPYFIPAINEVKGSDELSNNPSIIFYCGSSYEYWGPESVEKGIGGSEEATIHLAKRLVKLGWDVKVFNSCLYKSVHDGVQYIPFDTYDNVHEQCDIFIAWRHNNYTQYAPEGSKKIVWLHDVQRAEHWNPDRTENIDSIIALSTWHRNNLPEIEDEKFFVSRNGIDVGQFLGKHSRDPKRIVYASSPDRGLDTLLEMWPDIIKRDPEAELHIYYGFTKTFDEMHKNNQKMKDWKEYVMGLTKQRGVTYHGRVDHRTLAIEFQKSSIWVYPTNFTEISCITAMKAQAAGMIPVCTTVAALSETVQHGYKLSGPGGALDERTQKTMVNIVCKLLKDTDLQDKIRKPMMEWAKDFYAWDKVALEWSNKFKTLIEKDKNNVEEKRS